MSKYYSIPPKLYDDQFWWKKNDIEFWKFQFQDTNKKILEFGAGTGRLAIPLIREGLLYSGIEISNEYVEYAHSKHNLKSIIYGDMRDIDLKQKFDYLFIGFNSFAHLLHSADVSLFFDTVKRHMHSSSYFYIDIFMPQVSFLYKGSNHKEKIMDFFDSNIQEDVVIEETLDYDHKTNIISINWNYIRAKNVTYHTFKFQMKAYYPDTMNRSLIDAGFIIENLWGNYEGSLLTEESDVQIYQCKL